MELTELPEKELPPWQYGRLGDFFSTRAERALGGKLIPNAPKIKVRGSHLLFHWRMSSRLPLRRSPPPPISFQFSDASCLHERAA
eukprot:7674133-Prorocentrum_lima.AAC.1